MRILRCFIGLCVVGLAAVSGCVWSESNQVKPPKPAEEYRAPPEMDARYSKPIEYPKNTMDQDVLLNRAKAANKNTPGPLRPTGMNAPNPRGF